MNLYSAKRSAISTVFLLTFSVAAYAAPPNQIVCHNDSSAEIAEFLSLDASTSGTYSVSTETTEKYVLGLKCEFSSANELAFKCTRPDMPDLTLISQRIIEKGFVDIYGQYEEKDNLKITLAYSYRNNLGEYKYVQAVRQFPSSSCTVK